MAELAADEEALVRIEGIELMTEYLTVIKKSLVEADFIPNVEKMIEKAMDRITVNEIRIRMTKLSGKILDRLSGHMLSIKYQEMFMNFFK